MRKTEPPERGNSGDPARRPAVTQPLTAAGRISAPSAAQGRRREEK